MVEPEVLEAYALGLADLDAYGAGLMRAAAKTIRQLRGES